MSADSCIFCLELLSKATDRNLVDGKGKWGLELVDFPFVVQSVSPYICKQCLTLVKKRKSLKENLGKLDEQLTSLYQQNCAHGGITFKRKHPKRLTFSSSSDKDNYEIINANPAFPFPVHPGAIVIDNVQENPEKHQVSK